MQRLDSSLLEGAVYRQQRKMLELAFRSGAVYRYFGVPAQTYHDLLQAESSGRYFNAHIRGRFIYIRIS